MKKGRVKKLQLAKETLSQMDLHGVSGAGVTDDDCWVSRAFTNCTYCNGRTLWSDCTEV